MLPILFSLAALPFGAEAFGVPDDGHSAQQDGLLRFPIKGITGSVALESHSKRQDEIDVDPRRQGTLYTIDIVLGTPGQTVSVQFDTGSSELWVNPNCAKSFDPEYCRSFGRFTDSSTFADLEQSGGVEYDIGWVEFDYGYDFVEVGSARVSQQIFGVGIDSEHIPNGMIGAGPNLEGWDSQYPLLIDNLVTQGFINSRAFSLDIRALEDNDGAVIYGGIDTKKYSGPLEKLPIIPAEESPDGATRYWVNLNGITARLPNGEVVVVFEDGSQPVLLDSGYTLSGLPRPIFNELVEAFSATPITGSEQYAVDCSLVDREGTIDFTFGETVINVPYADFIWQQDDACYLGAFQSDESAILGDTFLRAAYVVFDWDNRNIHIANNVDCGSNLVLIGSGPDAVPSIVGECGATPTRSSTSTTATQTSSARSTTVSPTTSGPVTTPTSTPTSITKTTGWGNSTTTSHAPAPSTSTFTTTNTYTITACPLTWTDCPVGSTTTEVVTSYTTYCPETTGTYTLPTTYTCAHDACHQRTKTGPVTVHPHPTNIIPTKIPGCTSCMPPEATSLEPPVVTKQPFVTTSFKPGNNVTPTSVPTQPPLLTAGASKMWAGAPGAAALGLGAMICALL